MAHEDGSYSQDVHDFYHNIYSDLLKGISM